jgi:hypothetical protein
MPPCSAISGMPSGWPPVNSGLAMSTTHLSRGRASSCSWWRSAPCGRARGTAVDSIARAGIHPEAAASDHSAPGVAGSGREPTAHAHRGW